MISAYYNVQSCCQWLFAAIVLSSNNRTPCEKYYSNVIILNCSFVKSPFNSGVFNWSFEQHQEFTSRVEGLAALGSHQVRRNRKKASGVEEQAGETPARCIVKWGN